MGPRTDKGYRGDAAQFFVAGELCRRELVAVITLGNCPNTDILASNASGTRFCHVQVKTFVPGNRTVSVGMKAEKDYGSHFFWVLAGIPLPDSSMASSFSSCHRQKWRAQSETAFNFGHLARVLKGSSEILLLTKYAHYISPPRAEKNGWSLVPYRNDWQRIVNAVAP